MAPTFVRKKLIRLGIEKLGMASDASFEPAHSFKYGQLGFAIRVTWAAREKNQS